MLVAVIKIHDVVLSALAHVDHVLVIDLDAVAVFMLMTLFVMKISVVSVRCITAGLLLRILESQRVQRMTTISVIAIHDKQR